MKGKWGQGVEEETGQRTQAEKKLFFKDEKKKLQTFEPQGN